jgi:glycerophosphoryl diester phosphodiesterase
MHKKASKFLLILIILLAVIYGVLASTTKPVPNHPFFDHEGVMVLAHRGGRGLWPEDTLYAFEQAAQMGVDVLDLDIHSTADGVLVVIHDSEVDRTTNGTGPVHNFTLAELKELDAGYNWTDDNGQTYPFRGQGITIPTLDEVFTALSPMPMSIEIKQAEPPIVIPFCQMIRDFGMTEQVFISSFYGDVLKEFRRECPGVATAAVMSEVTLFFGLNKMFLGNLYRAPAEAMAVSEYAEIPKFGGELHLVTPDFITMAHKHNIKVQVWTVDEPEDMERLLNLGVDGIFTDYPDRLLTLLGRN